MAATGPCGAGCSALPLLSPAVLLERAPQQARSRQQPPRRHASARGQGDRPGWGAHVALWFPGPSFLGCEPPSCLSFTGGEGVSSIPELHRLPMVVPPDPRGVLHQRASKRGSTRGAGGAVRQPCPRPCHRRALPAAPAPARLTPHPQPGSPPSNVSDPLQLYLLRSLLPSKNRPRLADPRRRFHRSNLACPRLSLSLPSSHGVARLLPTRADQQKTEDRRTLTQFPQEP